MGLSRLSYSYDCIVFWVGNTHRQALVPVFENGVYFQGL